MATFYDEDVGKELPVDGSKLTVAQLKSILSAKNVQIPHLRDAKKSTYVDLYEENIASRRNEPRSEPITPTTFEEVLEEPELYEEYDETSQEEAAPQQPPVTPKKRKPIVKQEQPRGLIDFFLLFIILAFQCSTVWLTVCYFTGAEPVSCIPFPPIDQVINELYTQYAPEDYLTIEDYITRILSIHNGKYQCGVELAAGIARETLIDKVAVRFELDTSQADEYITKLTSGSDVSIEAKTEARLDIISTTVPSKTPMACYLNRWQTDPTVITSAGIIGGSIMLIGVIELTQ